MASAKLPQPTTIRMMSSIGGSLLRASDAAAGECADGDESGLKHEAWLSRWLAESA